MIKKYKKILLAAALLLNFLMPLDYAFAVEAKTAQKVNPNDSGLKDPDLKLSIEELRKKYPITWFDKKYGEYPDCEDTESDRPSSENLVCGFTDNKAEVVEGVFPEILIDVFKDFNEAQIKSIIIHKDKKSYNDARIDHIITIIFREISNLKNQSLLINKIRNFIYYDQVMLSFKELPCEVLKEYVDVDNKYYDKMALEYVVQRYKRYAQGELINKCIPNKKIPIITHKLNQQN